MGDATLEITQVDNDSQLKSQNKSMKVEILDWKTVGYWVWDIKDEDDICGICQNAFDGVCGTCDEPGEQCPLRKSPSVQKDVTLIFVCLHR